LIKPNASASTAKGLINLIAGLYTVAVIDVVPLIAVVLLYLLEVVAVELVVFPTDASKTKPELATLSDL